MHDKPVVKVPIKSSTFQYPIAGINHRTGINRYICNDWKEVYEAVLVPEPSNPYDSNAIRVEIKANHHHVGYVAKVDQQRVRSLCPSFPHPCQVHITARQGYNKTYYDGTIIL